MSGRVEAKRVEKPWGHELIWAHTDRYVGKILHIKAGHELSVQYHERKDETVPECNGFRFGFASVFRSCSIFERCTLQAQHALAFREIHEAVAREEAYRRRKSRQEARSENHDAGKGRKRARLRLPANRVAGDIYA